MRIMSAFYVILHIITTIAVIIFILHTVIVHRRINKYIKNLEKILKDHEVYLSKEMIFRNNITEIADRCTTVLTLCNNTNHEVISKLRNMGKDKDNKYNALVNRLNTITNLINVNYNVITEFKDKAKFSYNTDNLIHSSPLEEECNTKLKTAKKSCSVKENSVNKKNKKE